MILSQSISLYDKFSKIKIYSIFFISLTNFLTAIKLTKNPVSPYFFFLNP